MLRSTTCGTRSALTFTLSFLLGLTAASLLLNAAFLLSRGPSPRVAPALIVRRVIVQQPDEQQLPDRDDDDDARLDIAHVPVAVAVPDSSPSGHSHQPPSVVIEGQLAETQSLSRVALAQGSQSQVELNEGHSPEKATRRPPVSSSRVRHLPLPPISRPPPQEQDCRALIAGDSPAATLKATYSTYKGIANFRKISKTL